MPKQLTPLEIESYYVHEIHLKTNVGFDNTSAEAGEMDVDFDVQLHPDDPLRFQVGMSIAIGLDEQRVNEPYALHVVLNGYFRFKPGTSDDLREKMMFANAVPLLYGIARGCVGQVTGTGFYGPVILPPYNFVEHLQRKAQAELAAAEEQHQLQPAAEPSDAPSNNEL